MWSYVGNHTHVQTTNFEYSLMMMLMFQQICISTSLKSNYSYIASPLTIAIYGQLIMTKAISELFPKSHRFICIYF